MPLEKSRNISLLRVIVIFCLGLVSGVQIALYLYDYYDDGIADIKSLLIGAAMAGAAIGFILFSFASKRVAIDHSNPDDQSRKRAG